MKYTTIKALGLDPTEFRDIVATLEHRAADIRKQLDTKVKGVTARPPLSGTQVGELLSELWDAILSNLKYSDDCMEAAKISSFTRLSDAEHAWSRRTAALRSRLLNLQLEVAALKGQ